MIKLLYSVSNNDREGQNTMKHLKDRPLLFIDLETYSATDLRAAGAYRYAEDPDFQILMAAWATEEDVLLGDVHVAIGQDEINRIPGLLDSNVVKVAHNAAFERVCLSAHAGLPVGTYLPPEDFEDTMALAAEWGYPRSLNQLSKMLQGELKDEAGTLLINTFCKPNRKGTRTRPEDQPEKWTRFVDYCRQDVHTLIDVYLTLIERHGGWPTQTERDLWETDQRINDRGMKVDRGMAVEAVISDSQNRGDAVSELRSLTQCDNPNSPAQLLQWLQDSGLQINNLRADTVTELLDGEGLNPEQRRVLELRKETALSASKKYQTALDRLSADDRLRGAFQFYGAHTGRWAGRGVQPQNLPSARLELRDETAAILDLQVGLGADPHTLKALVRALFTGPFTVVDYSAIEARVIAWLAGEAWALEAFQAGRDIYVETAARMFGLDREEALQRRKQGKVAVLALGYNGGVGSLKVMGAEGTDRALQNMVNQWRGANPNIAGFWPELERAFRKGGPVGARIRVETDDRDRAIILPSGRSLVYHDVRLRAETDGAGNSRSRLTFRDPQKGGAWQSTYGGRLAENVTQAVARDLLAHGLLQLELAGYAVVGHVHDEVIVEGVGKHSVPTISGIITEAPGWATGLPLNAEGYQCNRYRKD